MKRLFLGVSIIALFYLLAVLLMAVPNAGASPIDDQFKRVHPDILSIQRGALSFDPPASLESGELLPIDPMLPWAEWCWVEPENGPKEVTFGKGVWVFENREAWENITEGFDFFYWNTNLFYRLVNNSRYGFYYLEEGNDHSDDYPQPPSQTPIPPSLLLFGSGLVGIGLMRRRVRG